MNSLPNNHKIALNIKPISSFKLLTISHLNYFRSFYSLSIFKLFHRIFMFHKSNYFYNLEILKRPLKSNSFLH